MYDPASADNAPDVRTSLAFYRGKVKVFETPVVERVTIDAPTRKAAVFQLEVPAGSLPPGFYTCQINVIDSIASKFAFPRLVFLFGSSPRRGLGSAAHRIFSKGPKR